MLCCLAVGQMAACYLAAFVTIEWRLFFKYIVAIYVSIDRRYVLVAEASSL